MEDLVIGWVHPGKVHTAFMDSVLRTVGYDRANGNRIAGWNAVQCSANVSTGRNALVEWFLSSPAQWLVQIDTDMVWQPDAVHRLLAEADPMKAPIVGGLCFGQESDTGRIWPTMYDLAGTVEMPEFVRYDSWLPDSMFPVAATGAAFLLVHRSAYEKVRDEVGSTTYPWFRETELADKRVGEDVTFCLRAQSCGIPVFVHTGVHVGHIKEHVVTTEGYIAQRIEEDGSVDGQSEVEGHGVRGGLSGPVRGGRDIPGDAGDGEQQGSVRGGAGTEANQGHEGDISERLVLIVPSRGRPDAARALAAAVRDTCTADTELVFVVDEDDPTAAEYSKLVDEGVASVIRDDHRNMVDALNQTAVAFATTDAPPFAVAFMGDDHMPRTYGWDAAYLKVLRELGTGMVFGNDLLRGRELPTQIAMTSDLVRALGYMAPPMLTHLYVDNFWNALGKTVGILRYLPDVVIEHRHPTAGKAKWDEGYKRVNDPAMYDRDAAAFNDYLSADFQIDVDKVRRLMPPMEWKLFDGPTPFVSTEAFHHDRERAPHLEQDDHRPRLIAAAELVAEAASRLDDSTVSDLGCGDGGLLSLLDLDAWGYDFQPSNTAGWAERGVKATALDVFGVDRTRVRFGAISVMTEVLEHIADPHGALRWVAKNSQFLVASSPRFENADAHVPEHAWAWNESGFAKLISGNGWTILVHEVEGSSQLILAEARP